MRSFANNLPSLSAKDEKALRKALKNLMGFRVHYLPYYITALTHRSITDQTASNNERLEYLGDAFIGAIVADYLFKKYPLRDEGYLTEMRSKIVSRHSLNDIARKMGLQKLLLFNQSDRMLRRSQIFGNALEAFVGAIYLDVGFKKTQNFLLTRIIDPYINMDELENTDYNFKNKLYSWAQHNNKELSFTTISESAEAGRKVFIVGVFAGDEELASASGYSKKEASQLAAKLALGKLEIQPNEMISNEGDEQEEIS